MHQQSACSVQTPEKKKIKKSVLDTVVSDHFSLRSKVGASALREVIFFFQIYPKSPGVLKFKSGRDGEQVYADGDQCSRNQWDWNDLGWQLQSAPLPSPPGLDWGHLSGWHQHSQIQRRYGIHSSSCFFSSNMPVCTIAVFLYTQRLICGWSGNFLTFHWMLDPKSQ